MRTCVGLDTDSRGEEAGGVGEKEGALRRSQELSRDKGLSLGRQVAAVLSCRVRVGGPGVVVPFRQARTPCTPPT